MKTPSPPFMLSVRPALTALVIALALVLVAAACGSDETATDETTTTEASDGSSTTADGSSTTASTDDGSTTAPSTTASASTTGTTELPGEPFEGFVSEGAQLAVIGVAHDDQLNIREGPGMDQTVLTGAGPTADDLVATGRARLLSRSIWYEVTVNGVTGWGGASFMAYIGATDDATAEYLADHDRPSAETMSELGDIVAAGFASDEPASVIVETVAPTVGDLGEVTVDVIGLGDDSVVGYRLHLFAEPLSDEFSLRSIERTWLCGRGTSGEICT